MFLPQAYFPASRMSHMPHLQDENEANCLLAAITVALDQVGLSWPVLLPVHDALRDAYWGAAVVPGTLSLSLSPHAALHTTLPWTSSTRAALMVGLGSLLAHAFYLSMSYLGMLVSCLC